MDYFPSAMGEELRRVLLDELLEYSGDLDDYFNIDPENIMQQTPGGDALLRFEEVIRRPLVERRQFGSISLMRGLDEGQVNQKAGQREPRTLPWVMWRAAHGSLPAFYKVLRKALSAESRGLSDEHVSLFEDYVESVRNIMESIRGQALAMDICVAAGREDYRFKGPTAFHKDTEETDAIVTLAFGDPSETETLGTQVLLEGDAEHPLRWEQGRAREVLWIRGNRIDHRVEGYRDWRVAIVLSFGASD